MQVGAVPGVTFPIEAADLLAAGSQQLLPLGRVPPLMLVGDAARRWALQRCGPPDLPLHLSPFV